MRGEVGGGWAEAEERLGQKRKEQPAKSFNLFPFLLNSKSKFKFKIQAKTLQINSSKIK